MSASVEEIGLEVPRNSFIRRALHMVERNLNVYKHQSSVIISGFFEPVFYLGAIGFGIGRLIPDVTIADGHMIPYAAFVAPGMLASAAMNGGITECFFNVFFRLNFQGTYESILATPMGMREISVGEMIWALMRGSAYAVGFLVVMQVLGLILSPWALLAIPASLLVSAMFAAVALVFTSFATKIGDFEPVMSLFVMPMFLFSTTFFPITVYPEAVRPLVMITPMYHGVSLLRGFTTGIVNIATAGHLAYVLICTGAAMWLAMNRLERRVIR